MLNCSTSECTADNSNSSNTLQLTATLRLNVTHLSQPLQVALLTVRRCGPVVFLNRLALRGRGSWGRASQRVTESRESVCVWGSVRVPVRVCSSESGMSSSLRTSQQHWFMEQLLDCGRSAGGHLRWCVTSDPARHSWKQLSCLPWSHTVAKNPHAHHQHTNKRWDTCLNLGHSQHYSRCVYVCVPLCTHTHTHSHAHTEKLP